MKCCLRALLILAVIVGDAESFQGSNHPALVASSKKAQTGDDANNGITSSRSTRSAIFKDAGLLRMTESSLKERDMYVADRFFKNVVALVLPSVLLFALSLPVDAAIDDSKIFNHDYADPFHPYCSRHIDVSNDGRTFHYSGTAVGPKDDPVLRGCSAEEIKQYGLRRGEFDGLILPDNRISAGDGIHEGVWEPANTATTNLGYEDMDGIRWNDGNKWVIKRDSSVQKVGDKFVVQKRSVFSKAGEGFFLAYIGFSTLAGLKALYDGIRRNRKAA